MSKRAVWKFTIDPFDTVDITMPEGSQILTLGVQNQEVQMWARVDPDARPVTRRIAIAGTGHTRIDMDGPYLGTVQLLGGSLVFHAFDLGEV